jgi:ribosomal protein S18 acetylase RimI-like enzyme
MSDNPEQRLIIESNPDPDHVRLLDDSLHAFNLQTTGVTDNELLAISLRGPDGEVVGGAYGWTWGETCHVRYLFVPAQMRNQGHGTRMMRAIEREAVARRCRQIVLETHDFQAPDFYRRLGFAVVGVVDGYPRGHQHLTMLKRLP